MRVEGIGLILDIQAVMKIQLVSLFIIVICLVILYYHFKPDTSSKAVTQDTLKADLVVTKDTGITIFPNDAPPIKDTLPGQIATGNIHPEAVVAFAESLVGTPYLYASTDPAKGFDCSGFITYVFNYFQIKVPRSSIDFTNVGKEVIVDSAKRGDIILFTGTDSTERFVGHMGIVVSNQNNELQFIHSSSGKAYGVVVTPLNEYYKRRFVKVIRIFKQL